MGPQRRKIPSLRSCFRWKPSHLLGSQRLSEFRQIFLALRISPAVECRSTVRPFDRHVEGEMVRSRSLLIVGLVAVAAIAGTLLGRVQSSRTVQPPPFPLSIDTSDLDFGEVWYQPTLSHTVTVRNTSDSRQVVKSITGSCSCQSFEPNSFTLDPSESRDVIITINLDKYSTARLSSSKEATPISVSIWLTTKNDVVSDKMILHGLLKHCLHHPDQINLGIASELIANHPYQVFHLTALAELDRIAVTTQDDSILACIDNVGDHYILRIAIKTRLRSLYRTSVTLKPIRKEIQAIPDVVIPVSFQVTSDLHLTPAYIDLTNSFSTVQKSLCINLRSLSGRKVDSIEIMCQSRDCFIVEVIEKAGLFAIEVERNTTLLDDYNSLDCLVRFKDGTTETLGIPIVK